jgi:hypothetical protein
VTQALAQSAFKIAPGDCHFDEYHYPPLELGLLP